VLALESTTQVDILVDVPADLLGQREQRARVGDVVGAVTFSSFPDQAFPVTLKEFATQADQTTQTFRATLTLPRPEDLNILPGMNAMVSTRFAEDAPEDAFWVPDTALLEGDGARVWVVDPEALTVSARSVELGETQDGQTLVVDGLEAGERVVAAGAALLQEGDRVRLYRVGMLGT